ncbi:hypothetical protein [Cupriavidus sp. RAF12]|uniref:hypothetical protein n=1 Tax=Cupriavidus sp. RAF12 TaxID=3233050 RepID=UPI003F9140DF
MDLLLNLVKSRRVRSSWMITMILRGLLRLGGRQQMDADTNPVCGRYDSGHGGRHIVSDGQNPRDPMARQIVVDPVMPIDDVFLATPSFHAEQLSPARGLTRVCSRGALPRAFESNEALFK